MYGVYYNDDCLYDSFEKEDTAINAACRFIERIKSEYIAKGNDDGNLWWLIRCIDYVGFPSYAVVSVINNFKKFEKSS